MSIIDFNAFKKIKEFKLFRKKLADSAKKYKDSLIDAPISVEEFNQILFMIDAGLFESGGCDDTLRITSSILTNHPQHDEILNWMISHGGRCDCEVLFNVVDDYYEVLENLEDSYLGYSEVDQEERKEILDTDYEYHIPIKNAGLIALNNEKEIHLDCGLIIDKLPKPWHIFSHPDKNKKHYQIMFGKNIGVGEKFSVDIFQSSIPFEVSKQSCIEYWESYNSHILGGLKYSDSFTFTEEEITLGSKIVNYATIKNDYAGLKIGFIYDYLNPSWYMVLNQTKHAFVSEAKSFINILKQAIY